MAVGSGAWPYGGEPSFDPSKYWELTVTVNPGEEVHVDSFSFWIKTEDNGPISASTFLTVGNVSTFTPSLGPLSVGVYGYKSINPNVTLDTGSSLIMRICLGDAGDEFGVAYIDSIFIKGSLASTLPIMLSSFEATPASNGVDINWTTLSENNNGHFIVERSEDALQWEVVATIDGAGNSLQARHYTITDCGVPAGLHYYRLTQVDFDGHTHFFDNHVVAVLVNIRDGPVYPNPAMVGQTVHVPPYCRVMDAGGRSLATSSGTFVPSTAGVYLVNGQPLVVE